VIAHHLDLAIDADHVIVMREGAVVEEGPHADLISRSGPYRSLWESRSLERVA
jgi:ABC-type transport system involved in Fe-S cluster assembly fused permease/ATPase subunit